MYSMKYHLSYYLTCA